MLFEKALTEKDIKAATNARINGAGMEILRRKKTVPRDDPAMIYYSEGYNAALSIAIKILGDARIK